MRSLRESLQEVSCFLKGEEGGLQSATDISPAFRGYVDRVLLLRADRHGGVTVDLQESLVGTSLDGVAAWELIHPPGGRFVDRRGDYAVVHFSVCVQIQDSALLDDPAGAVAFIDCLLQNIDIPTVEEVAVVAVARGVAVGKNEGVLVTSPFAIPRFDVVEKFIEESDETLWVRRWTLSVVGSVGVGDMALVVGGVKVLAVPA